MRSIGELARSSGLSVSALRFYDGAGVLVPTFVDPETGYRWYADHQVGPARLLAGLRRVGMPLAEIRLVLAGRRDPDAVRTLLDAHLRRLEDGLADARRELSRVHALLIREETPMSTRFTVRASALAAALDAVRFAVGADPELPAMHGVLLEEIDGGLRLVATDRYRLAVAAAPLADRSGPPLRLTAPAGLIDQVRELLPAADGEVLVEAGGTDLAVSVAGRRLTGTAVEGDFPDVTRLLRELPTGRPWLTIDGSALRDAVRSGRTLVREHNGEQRNVVLLTADPAAPIGSPEAAATAAGDGHVAVDREFLLDALDAGGPGQLVLELDSPIRPLAIRADGAAGYSILMPVRLD
ncbi:MerR family transcriptional regulator [Plantactinospora siamensis]|uniref:MerR family transcriptional regulator n=1 Tax=Plantactinospora siamensis TaxID=555372 RepID=A0ABV6P1U9_9ACTN